VPESIDMTLWCRCQKQKEHLVIDGRLWLFCFCGTALWIVTYQKNYWV